MDESDIKTSRFVLVTGDRFKSGILSGNRNPKTFESSLPVGVGVFLLRENPMFAFRGRHFGLYATRRSRASGS